MQRNTGRKYPGTVHADLDTVRKNLGGVHVNESQWERIKRKFRTGHRVDESFSAWVRRRLCE